MLMIVIGVFAVIGALLRDGLGMLMAIYSDDTVFPLATLIVNLIGCFFLGWFNNYVQWKDHIHPYIKTGVSTGLIGSFTTFSTFSVETVTLFSEGWIGLGVSYIVLSFFGGLLFGYMGFRIGEGYIRVKG